MQACHRIKRGFTLVELMVVVVLVAIILALAIPSFRDTLARNRLEGAAGELSTDLQYARSEAVARNATVGLATHASGACYTIYQAANPVAGSCDCTNVVNACTGGPTAIKTVSLSAAGITASVNTTIEFEPVRGMVSSGAAAIELSRPDIAPRLSADASQFGRVRLCSPSGGFKGYPSC